LSLLIILHIPIYLSHFILGSNKWYKRKCKTE